MSVELQHSRSDRSVDRSVKRLAPPTRPTDSLYRSYERTNERTYERISYLASNTLRLVSRARTSKEMAR